MKYLLTLVLAISFAQAFQSNPPSIFMAKQLVMQHEGYRRHAYSDTNHLAIGYGINLGYGISEPEAQLLLDYRLEIIHNQLTKYKWYTDLNPIRRSVIQDMVYNLGLPGFLQFKSTIWCLKNHWYKSASKHMADSIWFRQTGIRAKQLTKLMRDGK